MGKVERGEAASHFGGGVGVGGKDSGVRSYGIQATGDESYVCPHASGVTLKGVSRRWR